MSMWRELTPMAKTLWIALAVLLFLTWPQVFLLIAAAIFGWILMGRIRGSR